MSEEVAVENTEQGESSLLPGFKSTCMRIGAMMIVMYASRCVCRVALSLLAPWYYAQSDLTQTIVDMLSAVVFLNIIPIVSGMFLLKFNFKERARGLYKKPRYFGRSFGIFPAGYGLSIACALVTMLIGSLFPENSPISNSFAGAQDALSAETPAAAVLRSVHAVILAPIFEELWFRGLVLQSLRPYGNGFAVFISALMFGLAHANLGQFLYTAVIGAVLAYVAIQTESIVTTMVMHALLNSIATITSLFLMNDDVKDYMIKLGLGIIPESVSPAVTVFLVWTSAVLLFAFFGFISAIVKLVHFRRYRLPKVQTELSSGKRWGIFLSRPTVIIMLLMAFDTMTFLYVTQTIYELISQLIH